MVCAWFNKWAWEAVLNVFCIGALAEQVHSADTGNRDKFACREEEKWQNLPCGVSESLQVAQAAYPNWERLLASLWNGIWELF